MKVIAMVEALPPFIMAPGYSARISQHCNYTCFSGTGDVLIWRLASNTYAHRNCAALRPAARACNGWPRILYVPEHGTHARAFFL